MSLMGTMRFTIVARDVRGDEERPNNPSSSLFTHH